MEDIYIQCKDCGEMKHPDDYYATRQRNGKIYRRNDCKQCAMNKNNEYRRMKRIEKALSKPVSNMPPPKAPKKRPPPPDQVIMTGSSIFDELSDYEQYLNIPADLERLPDITHFLMSQTLKYKAMLQQLGYEV